MFGSALEIGHVKVKFSSPLNEDEAKSSISSILLNLKYVSFTLLLWKYVEMTEKKSLKKAVVFKICGF